MGDVALPPKLSSTTTTEKSTSKLVKNCGFVGGELQDRGSPFRPKSLALLKNLGYES